MTGNIYIYVLQKRYSDTETFNKEHKSQKSEFGFALARGVIPEFKLYGVNVNDLTDLVDSIHPYIKKVLGATAPYEEPEELGEHYTYTFCYRFISLKKEVEEIIYRQHVISCGRERDLVIK